MLHNLDLKSIDASALAPIFGAECAAPAGGPAGLAQGRSLITKEHKRRMMTLVNKERAAKQIGTLPARGESLHMIIRAHWFAPFDLLPAFIELTGRPAEEVWLTSLGINSRHVQALDEMLTAGQIKKCSLLLSHYFSKVDKAEFQHAAHVITEHGGAVAAVRSHAKLILARFSRPASSIVCESSGNLRSCRSVEQAAIFNDAKLFDFHRGWIRELLSTDAAEARPK